MPAMDTAVSVLIRSADAAFRFAFGDGLPDGVERAEGMDPNAGTNDCCGISATYTGVFQTTNALTFAALWGTGPVKILLTQVHIQRMMNELSVQTGKPSFELQYLDLSPFRKVRENQR